MDSTLSTNGFIRHKTNPDAKMRLICFANAGGSAALFRTWADSLPRQIEVCAVEMPGQGMRLREMPPDRLQPLIDELASTLIPYLDQPFAFFGYSLGGLVSFEMVRHLRRQGQPTPAHLFIAARRAPHLPEVHTPLHQLPQDAFIREVQRRYNGIPAVILQEPDLLALFVPVLRTNFALIENYQYQAETPLECPVSVYGGLHDISTSADELAGWRNHTQSEFVRHMFAGDHFFVQKSQAALLQAITKGITPHIDAL